MYNLPGAGAAPAMQVPVGGQAPAAPAAAPTPAAPAGFPQPRVGVMDLFTGRNPQQMTPVQHMQQGPAAGAPTPPGAAPAGLQHDPNAPVAGAQAPVAPNDIINKLLQNAPNGQQPAAPAAPNTPPQQQAADGRLINVDPAKLQEFVRTQQFAQGIDPQLVQRALSGDMGAFTQVLNTAMQNVFLQSALLNSNVVEQTLGAYDARLQTKLPDTVRNFVTRQAVTEQVALPQQLTPMLESLRTQVMQLNPQFTPAQVADAVKQILVSSAQLVTPPATGGQPDPINGPAPQQQQVAWADFFAHQ